MNRVNERENEHNYLILSYCVRTQERIWKKKWKIVKESLEVSHIFIYFATEIDV